MTDEIFPNDIPDFVQEAEREMAAGVTHEPVHEEEVTIKFGRGLVGEPFTSKNGIEFVEVKIPNADENDKRPWESFVISPSRIHENKFGKGVWMKLPVNKKTRLSRSVKKGMDEAGKSIWVNETREVTNNELKELLEAYKNRSRMADTKESSGNKYELDKKTCEKKKHIKKDPER